tara:strand:- start:13371 stop:13958 length:588 start_codon:yes stop_codon:yes gene_type:complete
MITFLKGFVEELEENKVHLDVNGVGYGVEASNQTLVHLKEGAEVKLLIHHHITDSDERLFGFYAKAEKQLFEKLITVKGVGPKLGITIVSGLPADHLVQAIATKDAVALSRVPGIGKKTAERIILELKDKIGEVSSFSGSSKYSSGGVTEEVISALESLGFKKRQAEEVAVKALQEEEIKTVPAAIKKALSYLNK